jgi:hypothetical protein
MVRTTLIRILPIMALAMGSSLAQAADSPAGAEPRTGAFQLHVPTRSKHSAVANIIARMGWGTMDDVKAAAAKDGGDVDYALSDETYEAFVPEDYDGTEPYGLLVWVNAGPEGTPPRDWLDVLGEHKLIWVGANNSGNNRSKWIRLGLAIDAAEHMQKVYKIDPLRVYVSGGSGGGRISSMLAVGFPDVITGGGFPMIGCDYFKLVELPGSPDGRPRYYRRHYNRPAPKLFTLAAKERRHVLLTGDKDANREQTEAYFNAMKKDGFTNITYLQVPGMGHEIPKAEWFEKGIVALDAGREAVAAAPAGKAVAGKAPAGKAPPPAEPASAAKPAAGGGETKTGAASTADAEDEPAKLMRLARLYINNRLYNKAREKLNQIVKEHPSSPPAAEARKLLKELGNK